jgi:hypothetical protein
VDGLFWGALVGIPTGVVGGTHGNGMPNSKSFDVELGRI